MATQKFKPGDKVKFTQEAKDRFDDSEYWYSANYEELDLDRVYTIKTFRDDGDRPNYSLEEKGTAPYIVDYLLEPTETEQTKKKMTKKEYLTKMVEECLDVQVSVYDGTTNPTRLDVAVHGCYVDSIIVATQNKDTITLHLHRLYNRFDPEDAQKLKDWMTKHGAKVQNTVNSTDRIVFKCEEYPWQCYTEPKAEEQPKPFKPGTKVRFTQEAKDQFDDDMYWLYANGRDVQERLGETFTVIKSTNSSYQISTYQLKGVNGYCPAYSFADYLLEEVPEEKAEPEPKREVAEIIRLRQENKELKAKIQELEAKLKDQKELKQGKVHLGSLSIFSFI